MDMRFASDARMPRLHRCTSVATPMIEIATTESAEPIHAGDWACWSQDRIEAQRHRRSTSAVYRFGSHLLAAALGPGKTAAADVNAVGCSVCRRAGQTTPSAYNAATVSAS